METLIAAMTEEPSLRLPGDRRRENRERSRRDGIDIPAELLVQIRALAGESHA
jgi:LDH2 family malate/lactate/ureidoglycolate dehydrogenase